VTTDEALITLAQQNKTLISQNEMLICLTSRLVWTPEKLVEIVMANKKQDPEAYISVYNALDGEKTGKQLGEIAGVSQQAISKVLQGWLDDGIVLNVGTDAHPKYRRLMRLPEKRKMKAKQELQQAILAEQQVVPQGTEATNGNGE
jgi:hypothetical protein